MPYPFTIASGWSPVHWRGSGPYVRADARYVVMQDTATGFVAVWKSVDEGETWSAQNVAGEPDVTPATLGDAGAHYAVRYLDKIYVLVSIDGYDAWPDFDVRVFAFDMATDTWDAGATGSVITTGASAFGNLWAASGVHITSTGNVHVPIAVRTDAPTSGDVQFGTLSAVIGGAWTLTMLSDMQSADLVRGANKPYTGDVSGDEFYVVHYVTRGSYNATHSCFASSGVDPVYSDVRDLRAFVVTDGVSSAYKDHCLVKAFEGTASLDERGVLPYAVRVLSTGTWTAYDVYVDDGTPSNSLYVVNSASVPEWDELPSLNLVLDSSVYHVWIAEVDSKPVVIVQIVTGEIYLVFYNGVSWDAAVDASTLVTDISTVGLSAPHMREVNGDTLSVIQNDQYWEFKVATGGVLITDSTSARVQLQGGSAFVIPDIGNTWYTF